MKITSTIFALLAVVAMSGFANAQSEKKAGSATKDHMAKKTECAEGCPIAKAMGNLPQMTYKVGEETTCCAEAAAKLAEQHSAPIHFVVADATFDQKEAAYASLVEKTEGYVNDFITPCKCDVSGKTTIAGESCSCSVMAGKRAELVKSAVGKVSMSYLVGDKACNCPHEADALTKSGEVEKYFVVGEEKTCCAMTGRLNLARAKYKAAVEAIASADKAAAAKTTAGS